MSTVTSADGTVVDYDRYGEGPVVVFVGGACEYRTPGAAATRTAQRLAEHGCTTIDYDRRGRGRTPETTPWTLRREVEDLAALLAAEGGPATLCTSSSGATVALAAVDAGLPVAGLVLYEPPFFGGVDLEQHLARLHTLLSEGRADEAMRYNLGDVVGMPPTVVEQLAHEPWWGALVAVAPTLLHDLGAVNDVNVDPDWARRWSGVGVPTVVCSGDQTMPGLPEAADAVAGSIPGARRHVLAGQGHTPDPDAFVPLLLELVPR